MLTTGKELLEQYKNKKVLTVIELLQKYAHETGVIPRSTTDLSSLECWLLNQLVNQNATFKK